MHDWTTGLSWPSANPFGHSIAFDRAPIVLPHLAAAWVILTAYWLAGQAGGSAMKLGCVLLPTTMASIRYRSDLDSPIPCPCWCSKRAGHGTRPSYAGSWTSARARCVPERWGCTGERGALMASILSDTKAHWHLLFLVGWRARGRSEPVGLARLSRLSLAGGPCCQRPMLLPLSRTRT
jgi:hypothetical protein